MLAIKRKGGRLGSPLRNAFWTI